MPRPRLPAASRLVLLLCCIALAAAACGTTAPPDRFPIEVVAAESSWGSLAAQLGGSRVHVTSIVTNPATDPHTYEPRVSDAIAVARSRLAVVNGIGYDGWASRLLAANGTAGRTVVDAGRLLGLGRGANPHQWYSPTSVERVVDAIARAYEDLDPAHAAFYAARRHELLGHALARYDALLGTIRRRFAGVPVGYSESVFAPLGTSLGLRLVTPARFARAIAEDGEVPAADLLAVERQIARRQIAIWVFNTQNVTPEVEHVTSLAQAAGIPVVRITETLTPLGASFEEWQSAQLARLLSALHTATGR